MTAYLQHSLTDMKNYVSIRTKTLRVLFKLHCSERKEKHSLTRTESKL